MAGAIQGEENPPKMRQDVVRHYILLGDPATRLRRPGRIELSVEQAAAGLVVTGETGLRAGSAVVTLERPRDKLPEGLSEMPDPGAPDFAPRMAQRCAQANETALARAETEVVDGAFRVEFPGPVPEGAAFVRAFAWNGQHAEMSAAALLVAP